jgi:predicted CoA-substrate-specific enzyme activase
LSPPNGRKLHADGEKKEMILGLDFGAEICKAVLLDESLQIKTRWEIFTRGNPAGALQTIAADFFQDRNRVRLKVGVTGSGRDAFDSPEGVKIQNELVSLARGVSFLHPAARSIVEVGAENSRWLLLSPASTPDGQPEILDFALNERCAAGSGAFLRQQASRLRLSLSDFSALAASARKGASIAGRCSVFAKSDMIHHQQKGTPIEEIAYGVCLALARNYAASISRGRECSPPVCMTGGGALNRGLLRAFVELLGIRDGGWIVPDWPLHTCALGAALNADGSGDALTLHDPEEMLRLFRPKKIPPKREYSGLGGLSNQATVEPSCADGRPPRGFLGVDVGSVSTNLALIDEEGRVLAGVYVPTSGRPIEAVREGYEILEERCGGKPEVFAIGATGSGRYLAGRLLRAEVIHNEITCQMKSAVHYFPEAETIFEIGGQDSKYIGIKDGKIRDFAMNKICAAGTGSFLEEQAEPLGIRIEGEFSALAAEARTPCDLGTRCTVFMDTELAHAAGRGVPLPELTAGLAYSIARNYLEKVVSGRPVGRNIVFQGGVASNASVVRAFSILLGRSVQVHPFNRISGAIGAALLAKEKNRNAASSSSHRGLEERIRQAYSVSSFECPQCSNRCQVNKIGIGSETLFFGDTCERYTSQQTAFPSPVKTALPDLFKEREDLVNSLIRNPSSPALKIGLPKASFMFEYLPFWISFFNRLGCAVVLSPDSCTAIMETGMKELPAETCLPIKLAFGHIKSLLETDADWVFFPSLVDLHRNPEETIQLCPYAEHVPFMVRSVVQTRLLTPPILFNSGPEDFMKSMGPVKKILAQDDDSLKSACLDACKTQKEFGRKLKARGEEVRSQFKDKGLQIWPVLGKPYNIHDAFLNLNLGRHLKKLGVLALPIDFIPSDGDPLRDWGSRPVWRYNQEIIRASLRCAEDSSLFPLLLSNFGCGPDALSFKHVEEILERTPHLPLEFDEHRAEAGLITRLEAFLDEVTSAPQPAATPSKFIARKKEEGRPIESYRGRSFVLPYFSDHVFAFAGALRGVGFPARILPPPDGETLALGEDLSSGKECHAFSIFAGDLAKAARSPRQGEEIFLFPGARYICLVTQFQEALNYLLRDLGGKGLSVLAPPMDPLFKLVGMRGLTLLWRGLVAIDFLIKAVCERRPYEIQKGLTDQIHQQNLRDIETALEGGSLGPALQRCVARLESVAVRKEPRPVVGIAGDLYTRQHPVANHDLYRKLEDRGCEVWPAPFIIDEVDLSLKRALETSLAEWRLAEAAGAGALILRKEFERWKVTRNFGKTLPRLREPAPKDILEFVSAYLGRDNNELVLLNIAKMVDFARRGADGIVNAICFNCMLGTVAEGLTAQIRRDYKNIPLPTLIYGSTELSAENSKLEAFVYQVHRFARKRKETQSPHPEIPLVRFKENLTPQ